MFEAATDRFRYSRSDCSPSGRIRDPPDGRISVKLLNPDSPAYVDTRNAGQVARFGDYMARWIGTGRSFF
jgi:hypothetical protein